MGLFKGIGKFVLVVIAVILALWIYDWIKLQSFENMLDDAQAIERVVEVK